MRAAILAWIKPFVYSDVRVLSLIGSIQKVRRKKIKSVMIEPSSHLIVLPVEKGASLASKMEFFFQTRTPPHGGR